MSVFKKAKECISEGFFIFPSKSKKDHIDNWPDLASNDPEQIEKWFGPQGTHRDWHISIFTGRFGKDKSLVIGDIDGVEGQETADAIEAKDPNAFPDTRTHQTPGDEIKARGRHVLYWTGYPGVKQGVNILGKKIDIRSKGGLIHFGDKYSVINPAPVAKCPPWILKKAGRAAERTETKKNVDVPIDKEAAIKRAEHYLTNEASPAIEGRGGDETTYTVANRVKDIGLDEPTTFDLMAKIYNARCIPPWDETELRKKVYNAYRYGENPPGISAPELDFKNPNPPVALEEEDIFEDHTGYSFKTDKTDVGNANQIVQLADGNLRHVPEKENPWLYWTGKRWKEDNNGVICRRFIEKLAKHYQTEGDTLTRKAESTDGDERKKFRSLAEVSYKWEKLCRESRRINSTLYETARRPRINLSIDRLDKDPWLLGCLNGVIDLRTGQHRPTARDEFITMSCPVRFNPDAKAPVWEKTIIEVTGLPGPTPDTYLPRPELASCLKRVLGYCLTGLTNQHKLFVLNGAGSNGKNRILDQVRKILGEYATSLPSEILIKPKFDAGSERATPLVAGLFRKRLAIISETKAGQKLDAGFVKSQTGEIFQKARYLHSNPFEFEISHKLILMTNALPDLESLDEAIKSRILIIPFDRTWNRPAHADPDPSLPFGDETLGDRLEGEKEGILASLVAGAVAFFKEGLNPPKDVTVKTVGYFSDQDTLGQWIRERCESCLHGEGETPTELLQNFNQYAFENDRTGLTGREFGAALKSRKYTKRNCRKGEVVAPRYDLKIKPWDAENEWTINHGETDIFKD